MICISISELSQLKPVFDKGAELIELRLDLLASHPLEIFPKIPAGIKTVATCRPGIYSEKERIALLIDAIELGASYVDLELESKEAFVRELMQSMEKTSCEAIFSHHDFTGTPGPKNLRNKLEECYNRGGVVAKIATLVHSSEDALNLLSLHSFPGRKVILGMGSKGRITRVAAPLLGSEFTFASPGEGGETAPGQMNAEQLQTIYNIINGS